MTVITNVSELIFSDFSENFNPFTWAELSVDVLKRVLNQVCDKSNDRMWKKINIYNQSCAGNNHIWTLKDTTLK